MRYAIKCPDCGYTTTSHYSESYCEKCRNPIQVAQEESKKQTTRPTRDRTMLNIAKELAERSTCSRRKVGCVLTDVHGRILAAGHNGVPKGMPHCTDVPCAGAGMASGTGLNACQSTHAEQNALIFCNDIMKIDTCYVTASPCIFCIKMIMNTACKRIVFLEEYPHPEVKDLWLTSQVTREWIYYTDKQ